MTSSVWVILGPGEMPPASGDVALLVEARRLAARLGAALLPGCAGLTRDGADRLEGTRPVYGSRLVAQVAATGGSLQIVTLRPGSESAEGGSGQQPATVERIPCPARPDRLRVLGEERVPPESLDLAEADIVVAGGLGVGSRQGFALVMEVISRNEMPEHIAGAGILVRTGHRVSAILPDTVVTQDGDGREAVFPADQVLLAVGLAPRADLEPILRGRGIECYAVRDCVQAREILSAVREAYDTALRIRPRLFHRTAPLGSTVHPP